MDRFRHLLGGAGMGGLGGPTPGQVCAKHPNEELCARILCERVS